MKIFTAASTISLVLLGATFAPSAQADEWNRKTVVTFSGPVEIPGVHLAGWGVLPAGTYVFKIMESLSDRHIVQIFNQDETVIYTTAVAIPNYRIQATDKTVMTFQERPAGEPEALRAWFYPGRNWGEEFVYPKAKASELARASKIPVLFTSADMPVEVGEPIKSASAPVVLELKRAPVMALQPSGEEVQLALVVTPPPAEGAEAQEARAAAPATGTALPATASYLSLIALGGLCALAAAFAVRAAASRI